MVVKRKVFKVGSSSLAVSLPSKWVQQTNIKAGDEVEILPGEHELTVATGSHQPTKNWMEFNQFSDYYDSPGLRRVYRLGYDAATVHFPNKAAGDAVKRRIANLIGADIIDVDDNKFEIIINNPSTPVDIRRELMRSVEQIKEQVERLCTEFEDCSFDTAGAEETYNMVTKRCEFLIRNAFINKRSYEEYSLVSDVAEVLIRIVIEIWYFYTAEFSKLKKLVGKELLISHFRTFVKRLQETIDLMLLGKKLTMDRFVAFRLALEEDQAAILKTMKTKQVTVTPLILAFSRLSSLDNFIEYYYNFLSETGT